MPAHTPELVLTPDFARSLVRFATLRTGSAVFDDDLVQEALLRGLRAFRRTGHIEHPCAFFSKIVRDTVRDHWRRQRLLVSLESVRETDKYVLDLEQTLDHDRRINQLRQALNLLPPKQRELLVLHYYEDVPVGELSVMLGKSRSALKMILLRGRIRIMQKMLIG